MMGKALGWIAETLIWMLGVPGGRQANVPSVAVAESESKVAPSCLTEAAWHLVW